MRKLFLLIAIFSVIAIKAQTIKTFNGKDMDGGIITYSYYFDDDGNEIKHGNYRYVKTDSHTNPVGNYSNTVTGTFKNGKKNGIWTNTIVASDYGNHRYDTYNTVQKHIYKDGIPDRLWTYSKSGKYRTKEYSLNGWHWSKYTPLETTSAQVNWKDGKLVSTFNLKDLHNKISGQFNNNGTIIGIWKIGNNESHYTNDGILKQIVNRGFNKVYSKNYDKEIELYRQYIGLPQEEQQNFLLKNRLKVDTVDAGAISNSIKLMFDNNKMFMEEHFVINGMQRSVNEINKYGKVPYLEVEFIEPIPLDKFIKKYNITFETWNFDYEFDRFQKHKLELSDEDINTVLEEFDKVKE